MKAEILTVGTELLLGQVVNENARYLSGRLAALGFDVFFETTVGDNYCRIREALRWSRGRADLVVVTGGLGPTEDDLTRQAVAGEMGLELREDPRALRWVEAFFQRRGRPMPAASRAQGLVPEGAVALENPKGTAPGLFIRDLQGKAVVLLPGPPKEMVPIWEDGVEPLLSQVFPLGEVIGSRLLKVHGMGEPDVEAAIRDLVHGTNPTVAPYVSGAEVHLRITAKAPTTEAAMCMVCPVEEEIRSRLGRYVFGSDHEELEHAAARALQARRLTLAVAESLTGGIISARVVNVAGASGFFRGGIVAYSHEAKESLAMVPRETIVQHGVVSWQCAMDMAKGARVTLGADVGVGVTGTAGPDAQDPGHPVGTVYLAVDMGSQALIRRSRFPGTRSEVRHLAAQDALAALRRLVMGAGDD
ncbi:MAG: competence/damage-inducible protein A [Bacillota bacterium]